MNRPSGSARRGQPPLSVIRGRRSDGPLTLQPGDPTREPGPQHSGPDGGSGPRTDSGGEAAGLVERIAERTADLQRLMAEYDNYRKRVRRDRLAVGEAAVANVLRMLLPVLDAMDRAREEDPLHGGLRTVAETLDAQLGALGLEAFAVVGEPFDPTCHEAVGGVVSAAAAGRPVCTAVLRCGYRVGRQLLRPAQVWVGEGPEQGQGSDPP
ncbi:nucleotide exchange factor GrpE [Streptomyces sp. ISL-94]|uniref:nucleotide exchange factor GrpE n=1 Tax=Streptomyces sp. ISL-94 TaxID=2819190 RepID=UPI001BE9C78A|nr:nucleotide exchange factor GrpE [Streptomyces sp. ISL-94]MBT2478914.1 nucleotide exchange factor GrpE [Streptomyces sp. ISL-94]